MPDPFAQYAVKEDPFAAYAVKPEAPAKLPESMGRHVAKIALDTLPGIGGIIGGALSTPETLGIGTVPGAALGVGAGQGLRDLIGHYTGLDAPTTPIQKATHIAGETGLAAATGYVLPGLVTAAKAPMQALREGAEQFGSAMPPAVRRLGKLLPSLPDSAQGRLLTRPAWQTWETAAPELPQSNATGTSWTPAPAPAGGFSLPPAVPQPTAARSAASGLSAVERAALVKQGYPAEVIAKIEAQSAPMASHAVEQPPVAPPESLPLGTPRIRTMASPAPTAIQPELQAPRVQIGAERVGRQAGMTTQDVRQAAGPVLDEAVGEASPILPKQALTSIIDKMRTLAPGAEREAYVAQATSGKAKWQVENIRRTLEHLGLIAPVAVAGPSIRDALIRMMSSHQSDAGS